MESGALLEVKGLVGSTTLPLPAASPNLAKAHFVLSFLLWHNKTAVRFGRNSFHLSLSEAETHQVKIVGVRKPVYLSQH